MAIIPQMTLFVWENEIERLEDLERLRLVIEYMPDEDLMRKLEGERGKGRDDYPVRAMWNAVMAGVVYQHPSAASLLRELGRNGQLRWLCGFRGKKSKPTEYAFSRYLERLFENQAEIDAIFERLVKEIHKELPGYGKYIAIDSKAIRSVANRCSKNRKADGRRELDANMGIKEYYGTDEEGRKWKKIVKWFGFKLHMIVDATYELPVSYEVTKASASDIVEGRKILKKAGEKYKEIINDDPERRGNCEEISGDKGYDAGEFIAGMWDKYGIKPVIDIRNCWKDGEGTRKIDGYENVAYDCKGKVYCYDDGGKRRQMVNGGFDKERNALKKLCPAKAKGIKCSDCKSCSAKKGVRIKLEVDRRIFTPIDRASYKWERSYDRRTAVERVNSRLDVSFGFENHYIRGIVKMKFRCSLALIVMLAMAYGRIREKRMENLRSLVVA